MKRLALAFLALTALAMPARAATLLGVTVTTAVTAQTGPVLQAQTRFGRAANMTIQGNFTYGSGGTSADAWVQTSIDGGATWTDVVNFHFLVASSRQVFNVSALTPVTTVYTPTDGTLAANTAKDGVIGTQWRVKYTTVGTYGGNTRLQIDIQGAALTAQ